MMPFKMQTACAILPLFLLACETADADFACVGESSHSGSFSEVGDLGGGLVKECGVITLLGLDERMRFIECRSGRFLNIRVSMDSWGEGQNFDDRALADAFEQRIKDLNQPDLDSLIEIAVELGLRHETGKSEYEACACRQFYPELLGNKERFDWKEFF